MIVDLLHRAKVATLERERETLQRNLALQESKIASMVHEQDVLTKLRVQAEATTHRQVVIFVIPAFCTRAMKWSWLLARSKFIGTGSVRALCECQDAVMFANTKKGVDKTTGIEQC